MTGKYTTNPCEQEFQLPLLFAALQLEQLEIDTQQEKLLFVELLTIDAKVCNVYTYDSDRFHYSHTNWAIIGRFSFAVGAKSAEYLFQNKIVSICVQSRGDIQLVDQ